MASTDPLPELLREGICDLLTTLSDPGLQRDYERNVPIAHVPSELLCMWFDDLYHPDSEAFRRGFSAVELAALEEFDRAYRLVADELEPLPARVADLHAHPAWGRVSSAAAVALKRIDGGGA